MHFYLLLRVHETQKPVAVVSLYSDPHQELFEASQKTYVTVKHLRDSDFRVVDIHSIHSVVMMAPDEQYKRTYQDGSEVDRWYMMEKPGQKILQMLGMEEEIIGEE